MPSAPGETRIDRFPFFLSVPRNLEAMLAEELAGLGVAGARPGHLGVTVDLSREELYRVVYASRLASRALRPVATFPCASPEELYDGVRAVRWERLFRPGLSFKVSSTVGDSALTHSQYAALRVKDAVVDRLRERLGSRPDVDKDDPDMRIDLHLYRDTATLSLWYSGLMHRRGYRRAQVEAPLKENLAAAVLRFSGWRGDVPLRDPFCGGGTFLIEAAMAAADMPAGHFRARQGFESWPDFSPALWEKVKGEAGARIRPLPAGLVAGSDRDPAAVAAARSNLAATPFAAAVPVAVEDFRARDNGGQPMAWIANLPYGRRLEAGDRDPAAPEGAPDPELARLYDDVGRHLKTRCRGSTACLLFPEELEKLFHFRPERRLRLDNGRLRVLAGVYPIHAPGPGAGGEGKTA